MTWLDVPICLNNVRILTIGKHQNSIYHRILYRPEEASKYATHCTCLQKHKIDDVMDHELIKLANKAIKNREKVWISRNITNTDRTVGAMLSGEITRIYGEAGLPDGTMICKFKGSAGQSFGAFLCKRNSF